MQTEGFVIAVTRAETYEMSARTGWNGLKQIYLHGPLMIHHFSFHLFRHSFMVITEPMQTGCK